MRYYKMLCFLDIKKISLWNLGKKVRVSGFGEKYLKKKAVSVWVLQLSQTEAEEYKVIPYQSGQEKQPQKWPAQ